MRITHEHIVVKTITGVYHYLAMYMVVVLLAEVQ